MELPTYQYGFSAPLMKGEAVSDATPTTMVPIPSLSPQDRVFGNDSTLYPITLEAISQSLENLENGGQVLVMHQLLVELLIRFPKTIQSRKDFFDYVHKMHPPSDHHLQETDLFDSSYMPDKALHWYTRSSFFYPILSTACSIDNMQQLFKVRYFIVDLYEALKKLHSESVESFDKILQVYHGKCVTVKEVENFKEHVGQLVITTTFLSTTVDEQVALFFAGEGNRKDGNVALIFRIFIDTHVNTTKPFALVRSKSIMADELEVLISLGKIFKVLMVEEKSASV